MGRPRGPHQPARDAQPLPPAVRDLRRPDVGRPNSRRGLRCDGRPRGVVVTSSPSIIRRWQDADERQRLLQVVQPGLIGLIDGTISTLAPIFAAAYLAGSRAALLVGLAAALGAAISMGLSESLSDSGELTGRGSALPRGAITGVATFIGGSLHA